MTGRSQTELYHFSEDPTIERFVPRIAPSSELQEPLVWAVDADHAHFYFFPRGCPRVTFCAGTETSDADAERFLGLTTARHIAAIEAGWLDRVCSTVIYRYVLPADGFALADQYAGYWISRSAVTPRAVEPLDDLIGASTAAGVELRILPSLWPLRDAVIGSSLEFSIIRWRHAAPPPATL